MSGTMPAYIRDEILDHLAKNDTFTPQTTVYAALTKTTPTAATAGTELTAAINTGYARVSLTLADLFGTASSGVLTTAIDILFPQNTDTEAWESATHVEFYDAATDGNRCLPWMALSSAVACPVNEQVKVPSGSGTITGS